LKKVLRERTGVILGVGGGQKLITPLTTRLQVPVLEKVLKNDCFGYINKPFDWDYLKLLIKKALRKSTRESNRKKRIK